MLLHSLSKRTTLSLCYAAAWKVNNNNKKNSYVNKILSYRKHDAYSVSAEKTATRRLQFMIKSLNINRFKQSLQKIMRNNLAITMQNYIRVLPVKKITCSYVQLYGDYIHSVLHSEIQKEATFGKLVMRSFKVMQGHRNWYQSKTRMRFPIYSLPL